MHKCGTDGLVVLLIQLIVLAAALPAWTGAAIGPQQLPAGVSADWWTRAQAHIRRVELVRGTLTEWYENDQRGLEQGFTLHEPPPGSTGAAELVLRMTVCGSLVASLDPDGATLAFAARDGQPRLHFGHLLAVDATGRKLPARFRLGGGNLDITVATTAAQYPLLIDPLATSPAWTAESDQAFAFFGGSVGTAGDVNNDGFADVIVGAPDFDGDVVDEGAVAVYFGSSTGLNQVAVQVRQPSNQAGANFGISVGTAGDVNRDGFADVIVGAYNYNNGQNEEGRAFVYHGSASGLGPTPSWTAEPDQADTIFGGSVGTAGDVNGDGYADVIVGAAYFDNG